MSEKLNRRTFMKGVLGVGGTFAALSAPEWVQNAEAADKTLPWENGKYQTFPRQKVTLQADFEGKKLATPMELPVYQQIDIGTLGPDVDTICGIDFNGNIPTGALVIEEPADKTQIMETRVVFIKRTDLETVQLQPALGGDRFDVYKMSKYGGDKALDDMARLHAKNTARAHQKVIYIGDLGLFEKQWGVGEKTLLNAMIRAQRPGKPELNIEEPNFVNPRT